MAGTINKKSTIKEGFICPVCYSDFRSPNSLLEHFQDSHAEHEFLKSIKEIVGKARKKILKLDERDLESFKYEVSNQQNYVEYSKEQDPGYFRSHTDYFKQIRRERLDHSSAETNRLIIRLDKLLRVDGTDRKQKEQELVTWLDGTTVTRCPSCACSFNIARRQHHCRLCGSIMCHGCSHFMTYQIAKTIVAPVYVDTVPETESDSLRICNHCMEMLENRRAVQMAQMVQPTLCRLYDNLRKIKDDLQPSICLYDKMYNLLISGDVTYQLQDAQALRCSIGKQGEVLDAISKQILAIPPDPEQPKASALQNSIRRATSQYIKEVLLELPILPSPSELEKIKQERLKSVDIENYNRIVANVKRVAVTTGWSPENMSTREDPIPENSVDPLMQQIYIVKNYIKQAREAHRYEEVASLQDNLRLLQATYQNQPSKGN